MLTALAFIFCVMLPGWLIAMGIYAPDAEALWPEWEA